MKKLIVVLMLVALGGLVVSDALAGQNGDCVRDCVQARDCQDCEPDCTCDGPNSDSDCPQIQHRPRDQAGQPDEDWMYRLMFGYGWDED